ncbi:MAG: ABC transporter substrate-binding protein [Candidatus Binatia bacterium]
MRVLKQVLCLVCSVVFGVAFLLSEARAETEKERVARLTEGAKKEGTVMFYGSLNVRTAVRLNKAFEKRYPFLKVKHYRAGSDTLMEKILVETKAGRYNADVYNMRSFTAYVLLQKGLFAKYRSPQSKYYPAGYRDPKGYWTSFYMNPATIGYNTSLVPPNQAPKDWLDLLQPRWKGHMVMDREESEWFANMLKIMGREKGPDFMKKLAAQNITYRQGHTLMAQLVAAGEFKVGPVLYTPRMEELKAAGAPIDWVRANPVIAYHYISAIAAHPPHPNAARLYIDFVLSEEAQKLLAKARYVPVRKGVKANPPRLVKGVNLVPSDTPLARDYKKYFDQYRTIFKVP